jgi:CubicO group peptidase (beta-lactamase class C family)
VRAQGLFLLAAMLLCATGDLNAHAQQQQAIVSITPQAIPPAGAPGGPLGRVIETEEEKEIYARRFGLMGRGGTGGDATALYDLRADVPGAARFRPLPIARERQRTITAEALETARAYAARNNSNALLIWRKGRIELEAYFGDHNRVAHTVSRSLAKPVTTAAIGRAIALGKITSLNQPVVDFVPEWKGDPRREKILIRHLLDMRTGFVRQALASDPDDVLNRAYLHPRHEEVIVKEYPVPDEPGSVYEYNNATSELVALVIQRATGRSYAEFVSSEIIKPIGAMGGNMWLNRTGGVPHSGCCFMTPADTWLRLALLYMRDGAWNGKRLLPAGYVGEMRTGTAQNPYYGLGVFVAGPFTERRGSFNPQSVRGVRGTLHSEPYLADDIFIFDGNANQIVYIVPSHDLIIVRTGGPPPRGADIPEWDNTFLPNTIMRGIVKQKGASIPQAR